MGIKITFLEKKNQRDIKNLISEYKFNDYRNYGFFTEKDLSKYIFGQVSELILKGGSVIVAREKSSVVGLVSLSNLSWESKYFGLTMSEIKHFIAKDGTEENQEKIKYSLLRFIFDVCKKKKIKHLSVKIDPADYSSIDCLETNGFRLMGSHLSYILNLRQFIAPKFKDLCEVRRYKGGDLRDLISLARIYSPPQSRFGNDKFLPFLKRNNYYVEWIKNACKGKFAQEIYVAARNNKICGVITYNFNEDLRQFLQTISLNRGIIIASEEGKGTAISLFKEIAVRAKNILKADFIEFEVYLHNLTMIRIFQKLGFLYTKSRHHFRKLLIEE